MFLARANGETYCFWNILRSVLQIWGPFLEGPEKFSDPESHNKNLQP